MQKLKATIVEVEEPKPNKTLELTCGTLAEVALRQHDVEEVPLLRRRVKVVFRKQRSPAHSVEVVARLIVASFLVVLT